jgi:hypothetical protein
MVSETAHVHGGAGGQDLAGSAARGHRVLKEDQ